ncbi:MAG: hypothetical protein JWO05_235 [Gemmatimonadetes bacterium]|nr:hypothetical protein [Gemmatimonadota bacterium]
MQLDIRLPIGALFAIVGVILTGSGLLAAPESYSRALGHNVNLVWGVVMLAVGVVFLLLARRGVRPASPTS